MPSIHLILVPFLFMFLVQPARIPGGAHSSWLPLLQASRVQRHWLDGSELV